MARSNELGAGDSDAGREEAGGGEGMRESGVMKFAPGDGRHKGDGALPFRSILVKGKVLLTTGVKEADCWNSLLDL